MEMQQRDQRFHVRFSREKLSSAFVLLVGQGKWWWTSIITKLTPTCQFNLNEYNYNFINEYNLKDEDKPKKSRGLWKLREIQKSRWPQK